MSTERASDEIIEFIAAGPTPRNVAAFRPSETARARVTALIESEREEQKPVPEEKSELDRYANLLACADWTRQ